MKRYKNYMDSVEVSETLHEKLTHLEQKKAPQPWKRYGVIAAAAALVIGLGSWGLLKTPAQPENGQPDIGEPSYGFNPDDGHDWLTPYELQTGDVVFAYTLPALKYLENTGTSEDYVLAAPGDLCRSATREDILTLVGGEENLKNHLDWPEGGQVHGMVWFESDGTPCAAAVGIETADQIIFAEFLLGGPVPSCVKYPDDSYAHTDAWGVEVTGISGGCAVVDDVELSEHREISFFVNDMGCKFSVYGKGAEEVERLCSRFARWGVLEGFDLKSLDSTGAVRWEP